ncbi:lck-interacting transmembrane adapter 1 isoform X2 [Octodon degus]|uniref:Lck-interacting transmembrane adapter 1 isoform X2 n=1 Tax=Octodon degus TaxID=10160 RepID=A0A6P6DJ62_OCTDE|nr:lck-interacting transmembrane adapter 1 isoform X2 [Octodon degus]
MGPSVPVFLPALWVLGCFSLLLWLWALCTACHRYVYLACIPFGSSASVAKAEVTRSKPEPESHLHVHLTLGMDRRLAIPASASAPWPDDTLTPRKQVQSHQAKLQDTVMLADSALLRQTHLCSLSTSDTRLHELHHGAHGSTALRPASMDLLHSHWLETSRSSTRPQAAPSAFPPQQLTGAPPATATTLSIGPGATYSNVGLPAIPRASLAASPVVWAGTQLTTGCDELGSGASPALAEYASIQKLQGTDLGSQELQQWKAKVPQPAQVDILYSRVSKPKIKDLRPTTGHPDCKSTRAMLESDFAYEPLPLRGLDTDNSPLENIYESIGEVGTPGSPAPPIMPSSISGHYRATRHLGKGWRPVCSAPGFLPPT